MKIKEYKPPASPDRPAPDGLPTRPFLCSIYASKGLGKTTLLVNLVEAYQRQASPFFDKLVIFSPTVQYDEKQEKLLGLCKDVEAYSHFSNDTFVEVLDRIKEDIADYKDWVRRTEIWRRFQKRGPSALTPDETLDIYLWSGGSFDAPPEPKFKRFPYTLIILDDQIGCKDAFSPTIRGPWAQFTILHRHLGCSIIWSTQIWKQGIPKQIKGNLDLWCFGRNKSEEVMREVAESLTSYASTKEIVRMWEWACSKDYGWFVVNLQAKDKSHIFTRDFTEPIPEDVAGRP